MDGSTNEPRFAIYYTPPAEDPLTRQAASWLCRDAFSSTVGHPNQPQPVHGALVADPARYGFHATLKAPFRLKPGICRADLEAEMERFAANTAACPIGQLHIAKIGGFFALVPVQPNPALRGFAGRIVEHFDGFRASMNAGELRRRLSKRLDDEEASHLVRWGYPYVFDRFRFHMTLTGQVDENESDALHRRLKALFDSQIGRDFLIDSLTLFEQPTPQSPFIAARTFPMGRARMREAAE